MNESVFMNSRFFFQPEQNQNFDHIEEAFQKHKEKKAKRESDRAKYGIYDDPQDDYNSRHAPGEQIMFPTKPNKVVFSHPKPSIVRLIPPGTNQILNLFLVHICRRLFQCGNKESYC